VNTHPSDVLREALSSVEPYPPGVLPITEVIRGRSFFPGGRGVWYAKSQDEDPRFPLGGIMVLGHYFYSYDGYRQILKRSKDARVDPSDASVWKGLQVFFDDGLDPKDCFFTNFFMGLSEGCSNEGAFPGSRSPAFVQRCQNFLSLQLSTQKPRVLLVLGRHIRPFLCPMAPSLGPWNAARSFKYIDAAQVAVLHDIAVSDCDCPPFSVVALVHPGRRSGTVGRRQFGSVFGNSAELAMVRAALAHERHRA
jgi:hypothetical protein